jgi:outer membrane receptor for ferrienterochelin and colicin
MRVTYIAQVLIISMLTFMHQYGYAQGKIKGNVQDESGNEVLEGARIILLGANKGALSDASGNFIIEGIPAGTYDVICSYISYQKDTLRGVKVVSGKETEVQFRLKPEETSELEEIQIVEIRNRTSDISLVSDMRSSDQVTSGVSSEQIRKSPDRDAAEVIRRMPGVTLTDGRFAMIRGLNERYNTVLLNDGPAPAAEADTKAFSFDLIPASLISRMMMVKTPSAEYPGEMAGGMVKIETQTMPDKNGFHVSIAAGLRQYTSFQSFRQYTGSSTDFLGFDDGTRALPTWFPQHVNDARNPEFLNAVSKSMPNTWAVSNQQAMPDPRMQFSFMRKFQVGKFQIGTTQGLTYSQTSAHQQIERYNYNAFNAETKKSDTIYQFSDAQYQRNTRLGYMSNWALISPSGHKIEFRNLFNQSGQSQTTIRTGRNLEEGSQVQNYSLGWQQRGIFSSQLSGSHPLIKDRTEIKWQTGFGYSGMQEPDLKRVRTIRAIDAAEDAPWQVVLAPTASTLDASRFFSKSTERVLSSFWQIKHTAGSEAFKVRLLAGMWGEQKSRSFQARWMSYKQGNTAGFNYALLQQSPEALFDHGNMNVQNGLVLNEGTNPSDGYEASNLNLAGYTSGVFEIQEKLKLQAGIRTEYNRQQLSSSDYNNRPIEVYNPILFFLPSGGVSYQVTEKTLVRFLGGITVNRPEFRELAPFAYYDFAFNNVLYGNPELQTPRIRNLDVRWEYYTGLNSYIHAGLFRKVFVNPIEQFFVPGTGSGGTRNFTFNNADRAVSNGVELEVRQSLGAIIPSGIIQHFGILMNAALIRSEVDLGTATRGQTQIRPMQGQAPYVVNAGLEFTPDTSGLRITALYNVYGKRLFAVGTFGTPDIYEMPRHQLDLTLSKRISRKSEIRFTAQDILNARFYLKQDSNEDGKITQQDELILDTRRGRYFTFGFTLSL